jgi:hypothetical protein
MSKKKNRTKEEWFNIVKNFLNSNKTAKQWCKDNSLALSTFERYKKLFKDANPNFIKSKKENPVQWEEIIITPKEEVKITDKQPVNNIVKISLGKVSIDIAENINKDNLKNILSVVMDVC